MFNGLTPPTFLEQNRRFQNQLPVVSSPEARCPSTPSPTSHRSIGLCTKENIWILCFQSYPSLMRRAAMKRSLNKIAGFGEGGYRRIRQIHLLVVLHRGPPRPIYYGEILTTVRVWPVKKEGAVFLEDKQAVLLYMIYTVQLQGTGNAGTLASV